MKGQPIFGHISDFSNSPHPSMNREAVGHVVFYLNSSNLRLYGNLIALLFHALSNFYLSANDQSK